MKLQIEDKHLQIIKSILNDHQVDAYVFGSRAKMQAKKFSDLDLCLMDQYDKTTIRKVQDSFEESDLPFKVDIVCWGEIDDNFKAKIKTDLIKFEL
jgi:predicted nucleotidyltransferase